MTTLAESPTTASLALGVASKVGSVGGSAIWAAGSYLVGGAVTVGGAAAEGLARAATASPEEGGTLRPMGGGSEVLRIANALEGILGTPAAQGKIKQPEVPRLVVVGTQSSGKSSLLNGIMAADILPLGEQMCTRAPLSLQLVHTPDPSAMRAEFGGFTSGVWAPTETIALQCPDPTAPQLAQIRAAIESQTSARAGAQKGVSHEPIFLRIHSPHVPNLSLVDLPGLTMTALTDQGQPRDIKAQIKRMIGGYIEQERTIILMVCPARMDLEADPALELVKEYDPQGNRTVGVLTKIDLMNAGSDVSRYLANAVPADLQLRHGYFAVRNRAPAEVATATVADGFGLEEAYFAQHPTYAKAGSALRERLGVPPLSRFLARILSDHLRQHLPEISREIHALVAEHEQARETPARTPPSPRRRLAPSHSRLAPRLPPLQAIHALGPAVPPDDASKASLLQTLLATFCRDFSGALVEKRADVKTGRKIKDAFVALQARFGSRPTSLLPHPSHISPTSDPAFPSVALQANLRDVAPFDASQFSDETLLEACRDCEGNHLSFPIPPIEMIEHMLQHPEQRPIRQLLPACLSCLSTVTDELRALRDRLLQARNDWRAIPIHTAHFPVHTTRATGCCRSRRSRGSRSCSFGCARRWTDSSRCARPRARRSSASSSRWRR